MNESDSPNPSAQLEREQASPVPSLDGRPNTDPDAPGEQDEPSRATTNGVDGGGDSEAETEIESPVKKREAEKQQQQGDAAATKQEKAQKSRIGSLPVPHDDDEDGESAVSAFDSTDLSVGKTASSGADAKQELNDAHAMDRNDLDDDSDELSSPRSADESESKPPSRAASERLQQGYDGAAGSPNPRKRKHRASSVSLPSSKRQSMEPPKRTRLRGTGSEGLPVEDNGPQTRDRSQSPRPRSHRRTVSTQSAVEGGSRKRRSVPSLPGREPKSAKTWEDSDASSETTSRGQDDGRRPQRSSTNRLSSATPGRAVGREHKRHINKYGFTRLAEACEDGNLDHVKEWREKDPDSLEVAEFAGNKPLQIAALNGNSEVVSYLIEQGCQIDCCNVDKDTPLIDAAENGHLEVVKLLLDAGVDPLRQNQKGQQALDAITDETDDAGPIRAALHSAIDRWNSSEAKQRREEEEEHRHRAGPSKELHFMARTYENLLKLVQNNDRNGVREFLAARVPVDNAVIAAAARTGDLYLVNMLLAEMTDKKAAQKPEKPMLSVLGTSHFEMVVALTQLENFNAGWRSRAGKSWAEIAEERGGPMWRREKDLLLRLEEQGGGGGGKDRLSSSPVIKRDGKRRFQRDQDEEDDDEESSSDDMEDAQDDNKSKMKRKNGRRLMSRRDMRAVGGTKGALSDSSDGEEDAEGEMDIDEPGPAAKTSAAVPDETMKPPETPNTRRRLRSKSISSPAQPPAVTDASPKTKTLRRRSSSLRGAKELPALNEENDTNAEQRQQEQVKVKKEREDEAKFRLDEAKRLEEKRKEEEAAALEAKRAEEAAKRAEEERKAEESRKAAEVLRQHEEAEQAKREEEERLRKEREAEEAEKRRAYVGEVVATLPLPLARVFDPDAAFDYNTAEAMELVRQCCLPLRVLRDPTTVSAETGPWTLNLQAAPLLTNKSGLQLFFQPSKPGYDDSLAAQWTTPALTEQDWRCVDHVLARLPFNASSTTTEGDDEVMQDADLSLTEELKRTAQRYQAFVDAKTALRKPDCPVGLRRVKLADVRTNLHPGLQQGCIELDSTSLTPITLRDDDGSKASEGEDFVTSLRRVWERQASWPADLHAVSGTLEGPGFGQGKGELMRWEDVVCVHEK